MKRMRLIAPIGSLIGSPVPPVGSVAEVERTDKMRGEFYNVCFPACNGSVERRTVLRAAEVEKYFTEVEPCES